MRMKKAASAKARTGLAMAIVVHYDLMRMKSGDVRLGEGEDRRDDDNKIKIRPKSQGAG